MSSAFAPRLVPVPRILLVLAGAASQLGSARTPLELARMPQLRALGVAGRASRLQTLAGHLPVTATNAAAALLGTIPPMSLDPGAVAVQSLGLRLAADESCTVVRVLDLKGDPAPILDVTRAADALRRQLVWHRVIGVRRGNQILLGGVTPPQLPWLEGLQLVPTAHGFLPARRLDHDTLVLAEAGSSLLGVGSVLGARAEAIDAGQPVGGGSNAARLREHAIAAMIGGQPTTVIESRALLDVREASTDAATREAALCAVLEDLDRELVGPLHSAAAWLGATLAVTADLPRDTAGVAVRGQVPLVIAGPRAVLQPEASPLLAPLGTTPPPRHSERGAAALPLVTNPFADRPARNEGPMRFTLAGSHTRPLVAELALL